MIKIEDGDYCKTCELVDKYNELEERINKAIHQIEEIKNNAVEYKSYHDAVIFSELLEILKGDSNG